MSIDEYLARFPNGYPDREACIVKEGQWQFIGPWMMQNGIFWQNDPDGSKHVHDKLGRGAFLDGPCNFLYLDPKTMRLSVWSTGGRDAKRLLLETKDSASHPLHLPSLIKPVVKVPEFEF